MHHIHTTHGIVLGKRGVGEAGSLVYILTRDLGLVRGSARSTRVEASKLRYGLDTLTCARYGFVKGKHEWRLVQVHDAERLLTHATPHVRAAAGRICQLLLRLIRGTEPQPNLYKDIEQGFAALQWDAANADAIETVLVLRILSHLGYLPHTDALAPFVESDFSVDLAAKALNSRSLLIKTINESLHATGL